MRFVQEKAAKTKEKENKKQERANDIKRGLKLVKLAQKKSSTNN